MKMTRRIRAWRTSPERAHAILRRNARKLGIDQGEVVSQVFVDAADGWKLEIATLRHGAREDVLQAVHQGIFRMRYQVNTRPRNQVFRSPHVPGPPTVATMVGIPGETVPGTDVLIPPGQVGLRFGICIHAQQMQHACLVPPARRARYRTNRDLEGVSLYVAGAAVPGSMVAAWLTVQATHVAHGGAGLVAGVAVAGLTGLLTAGTWFLLAFGLAMDASPYHAERARGLLRPFFRFLGIWLTVLVTVNAALLLPIALVGVLRNL